jgi:hypothetical protein
MAVSESAAVLVVSRKDEHVLESVLLTIALALPGDPVAPQASHRVTSPSRGNVGRFLDSNVASVWDGAPFKARIIWMCIRNHESHSYTGHNPRSTASGAGQWLDSTWRGLAPWVKVKGKYVARGYRSADRAPAWVQDAAFLHVYRHGGLRMWHGTWCPGT